MFTGIIEELGEVVSFEPHSTEQGAAWRLTVRGPLAVSDASHGDSIAVNGLCLTVVEQTADAFTADVMQISVAMSTLGDRSAGDRVNLERAAAVGDRLGGHIVQGHIDGIGVISRMLRDPAQCRMQVTPNDRALMRCIVEKGSIAVDGVSLTVAATGEDWFETALIPTTLKMTNLGTRAQGIPVNLETDYLAKVIVNYLERTQSR